MNRIILGNLLSLLGAVLMVGVGLLKKRKQILLVQCVQFGIMGVANLILGGITGALSGVVNIVRNIICLKYELTVPLKLTFIAALLVLCLCANTAGWLGVFPILSACIYTWFLDVKKERTLKVVIIVASFLWTLYDFSIQNYVSFVFNIFTILSNGIGIILIGKANDTESIK